MRDWLEAFKASDVEGPGCLAGGSSGLDDSVPGMPYYPPAARPLGPDVDGQWVRRWMSTEWTRTVDAWVGRRLAEQGRRISGEPLTYRARFWSVVRCYPSTEGLVWFKENNPGHRFEAGLVAALARLAPEDVIVPIAVERERSWLLTDDQGTTLTHLDVDDQPTRCIVVRALARLQCAFLGRLNVAERSGILELAPSTAGDRVRAHRLQAKAVGLAQDLDEALWGLASLWDVRPDPFWSVPGSPQVFRLLN